MASNRTQLFCFCIQTLRSCGPVIGIKGSRQWESRGVRNVSNCTNLVRTAAIEVCFSLNFAVVFDFIYFRFRPSKAKSIGNVLPNRQNAAKRAQEICWRIKDGYTCAAPVYWCNDACCAKRVQICSVYNFQILFRGFFFLFAAPRLMTQDDAVRQ